MTKGFFITGTDTDVGKTRIALGLINKLNTMGHTTTVMKPLSAGCDSTPDGLRNDDAVQLIQQASFKPDYDKVNPYAFKPAIAPHLAAEKENTVIDLSRIKNIFDELSAQADYIVVEGAGGWKVPINKQQTMAELASALALPVILVTGMRLGCLNHAILTIESIQHAGIPIAGWIANTLSKDFTELDANIKTLKEHLEIPFLGTVPYMEKCEPQQTGQYINISHG
jgi:dethiobiotin synthetase